MDIFEVQKRINKLGYYDSFLDHESMYLDHNSPANPQHPDHAKYLIDQESYLTKLDKDIPPDDRTVATIIKDIELFELEVIPEIKTLAENETQRAYLKSYLLQVLNQLDKLKREMFLENSEIEYFINSLNLGKPLTAKALIEIGIPESLNYPIDPNDRPIDEFQDNVDEDNRFRTAIYITLLKNLILETQYLFSNYQESFQLRNFQSNKIYLEELFKYSHMTDDKLIPFLNLFNSSNPIVSLNWIGDIGDLRSIILSLNQKHLLVNLKAKTHWEKCILCFKDHDGKIIPKRDLTNGRSTNDHKNIVRIINKMK